MNITPLIDVLLVLLVIFLAALPLTQKGLDANLPSQTAPADVPRYASSQIMLEYTADRRLSINRHDVLLDELELQLRGIYAGRSDKTLYISGAASLRYRDIVEVIDAAKGAGVQRVGVITEGMKRSAGVR